MAKLFKQIIEKFNPYHDKRGRFTTGGNASFMTIRTKDPSKQKWADMAVARAKEADKKKNGDFAGQISGIKAESDKIKAQIAEAQKEDKECADKIQALNAEERIIKNKMYEYESYSKRFDGSKYKDGYDVDGAKKKLEDLTAEHQKVSDEIDMWYRDRPPRGTPEYDEWKEYRDTHDVNEMWTRAHDLANRKIELEQEIKGYERYKEFEGGAADQEKRKARVAEIEGERETLVTKRLEVQDRIPELAKQNEVYIKKAGALVADEINRVKSANDNSAKIKELEDRRSELAQRNTELSDKYWRGEITFDEFRQASKEQRDQLYSLQDDINALKNGNSDAVALKTALGKVRSMGVSEEQSKNMKTHLPGRSTVKQSVRDAYEKYPTEWVEQSMQRGPLKTKKADRGYYSDSQGLIAISGWDKAQQDSTAIHELGHRMERVVPGMLQAEQAFYNRRTAGESLQRLKDVTGVGYRSDETTRKDDFIHPYMGKDYGGTAYELVSMGFEYAYTKPDKLAQDPDYQQFIYGLLAIG